MRYIATYRIIATAVAVLAVCPAAFASKAKPAKLAVVDAGASAPDAGVAGPQNFSAEAPPKARFGETFPYVIRVSHAKGEVYALPREPDFGEYDLVSSDKKELPNGDQVTTVFNLQLRAWAVGQKAIPDLALEVTSAAGASKVTIPGPTVDVLGTIPPDAGDDEGMRDIAPPVDVPVRTWRLLIALAVALGVGILAYALMQYLKRPKPAVVIPAAPPEPAHLRAKRALEALLTEDLAGRGKQRELYFRLSEIVRRYLGERFGFDAIDLTTEELLAALRKRSTPGLDLSAFARECQEADLVKFAKLQPDANACKTSVDAAIAMVNATLLASQPQERSA